MSQQYVKDPGAVAQLTPEQFEVTQLAATEPPFHNAYWDNHEPGIYVDVISGEPLFASVHKFDSGTGWPSFYETLKKDSIVEKKDDAAREVGIVERWRGNQERAGERGIDHCSIMPTTSRSRTSWRLSQGHQLTPIPKAMT